MFESLPEERQTLLPTNVDETRTASSSSSLFSRKSALMAVACLVTLGLLGIFSQTVGDKKIITTSLEGLTGIVSSYDNKIGPSGEVYCDEEGMGECLERTLGYCWKHGPCEPQPTSMPTSIPTAKPSSIPSCDQDRPPCKERYLGVCIEYVNCAHTELPTSTPTRAPTTSAPTSTEDCDPKNPPCKVRDGMGICWEYYTCVPSPPTHAPTSVPTPKPSSTTDCDPLKPPCKHDFLSICYEYWDCEAEGNHDSYPPKVLFPPIPPAPTMEPTEAAGPCDPKRCVPGNLILGVCWKFEHCEGTGNSTSIEGIEGGEGKAPAEGKPEEGAPAEGAPAEGSPAEGAPAEGAPAEGAPAEGAPAEGKPEEGAPADGAPAEGAPAEGAPAEGAPAEGAPAEGKPEEGAPAGGGGNSTFPTFPPFALEFPDMLTAVPSFEPTTKHNCDPEKPPCKSWTLGVCTEYEKCFGIHSTPNNMTFDDDEGYTFAPTPIPVPNPTPQPSHPPTSVPSTSAPTLTGYTPSPTLSMRPTAAETSGPTQALLCDPQKPPCDNYFFGICLGIRHCLGSHEPTPSPTPEPTLSTDVPWPFPTLAPTDEPIALPTYKPTVYVIENAPEESAPVNATIEEAPEESAPVNATPEVSEEVPAWKAALLKKMAEDDAAKEERKAAAAAAK